MSKKRKDPPQSSTLHRFFNASGVGSSTTKARNRTPSKAPRQESQEIIVIDTDEEVETQTPLRSVPKELDGDSSDVEIVEVDARPHKRERSILRDTSVQLANIKSEGLTPSTPTLSANGNDENVFSTCQPNVNVTEECSEQSSSSAAHLKESESSTIDLSAMRKRFYGEDEPDEGTSFAHSLEIPLETPGGSQDYFEDWDINMVDDELEHVPEEDNDIHDSCEDLPAQNDMSCAGPDVQVVDDPVVDESCPICGLHMQKLKDSDKECHVNNCLDSFSSPSDVQPVTSSSKSKLLKPLSSFFSFSSSSKDGASSPLKTKSTPSNSNAFSVLMSKHGEKAAWEEAQVAENRSFKPTKSNRRKAPFYKVMQGMPIAVDAFRYGTIPGITAYFLTHAHSDHYTNLSSNWKNGLIYCSETTANLISHMLSVDRKWVRPLPMDMPTEIPNTGGVKVTLIEANHCPGSCLFLFEGPQTVNAGDSTYKSPYVGSNRTFRYLHCGDFRACPKHVLHPAVKGKRIDHCYLDTTYLNPKYCFPPQPLVISACAELARRIVKGECLGESVSENSKASTNSSIDKWMIKEEETEAKGKQKLDAKGDVLVVVGTYSIGKERIVKAIARTLKTKVYCDNRKSAVLRCQDDPELHALLTKDPLQAGVHVVPLSTVASDRFQDYMDRWKGRWSRAVAFRPTGWTYTPPAGTDLSPSISQILQRQQSRVPFSHSHLRPARNSTSKLMQYGVPYSEHSSFFELTAFALSFEWVRMIATVNVGSATSRAKMDRWVEKWQSERKKRMNEGKVVVQFRGEDYW